MNNEQKKIWNYLNRNAKGFERRISSSKIRDDLGIESGGATNENIRNLIRDMILNHNCCIGSEMWASGYWIIQTEDELDQVCESLEARADSIRQRAIALRRSWEQENS